MRPSDDRNAAAASVGCMSRRSLPFNLALQAPPLLANCAKRLCVGCVFEDDWTTTIAQNFWTRSDAHAISTSVIRAQPTEQPVPETRAFHKQFRERSANSPVSTHTFTKCCKLCGVQPLSSRWPGREHGSATMVSFLDAFACINAISVHRYHPTRQHQEPKPRA